MEAADPGFEAERLWEAWVALRQWMVAGNLAPLHADPAKRDLLKPEARWEVEGGLALSALDVHHANQTRSAWHARLLELFETYDFLALPSAQVFPFPVEQAWPREVAGRAMDTYHRWMEVVVPGSLSGGPVISLPAGFNANGLPMGLQLIGRPRDDLGVLQLAHAFEQAAGDWLRRLPEFSTGH